VSRRCGFPFLKTIDDFDFTYQSTVKLSPVAAARRCRPPLPPAAAARRCRPPLPPVAAARRCRRGG
jgi:hypothetical protein